MRAVAAGIVLGLAAWLAGAGEPVGAAAALRVVGTLTCDVPGPDVALHFGSNRPVRCVYHPRRGRAQVYAGHFRKYGVEVGVIGNTSISWRVLAPTSRIPRRALAGTYRGFTVEATIGVGSGANILVREGEGAVHLDPIGMQTQTGGLNAAVGVTQLDLRPAKR
ncbi:DUF992 domain-containing protein [Rhodoligotrophos defluvii]|uniref:DUF992 domain-containing protein n=1 Tax=Rhodoligotrophos defluvii TaxID=2561934 RepID=UPI001484E4F0|nr:DUF992 domain-containing protein [Rhodoligotrophos defluvii]